MYDNDMKAWKNAALPAALWPCCCGRRYCVPAVTTAVIGDDRSIDRSAACSSSSAQQRVAEKREAWRKEKRRNARSMSMKRKEEGRRGKEEEDGWRQNRSICSLFNGLFLLMLTDGLFAVHGQLYGWPLPLFALPAVHRAVHVGTRDLEGKICIYVYPAAAWPAAAAAAAERKEERRRNLALQ